MRRIEFTHKTMFALTMQHKDLGIRILERILGRKVKDIKYVDAIDTSVEETVMVAIRTKSVRLDVLFEDDTEWYNVEMQVGDEGNVPKRSRYIHSIMDVRRLGEGEDYNQLKKSYVVFICCFDLLGDGKAKYFFETFDRENNLSLGDERYTIILNTKAECVPEELKTLFDYINYGKVDSRDKLIEQIGTFVDDMNEKGVGETVMTMQEDFDMQMKRAINKAVKEAVEEAVKETTEDIILGLVKDGTISPEVAAAKLNISVEEVADKLN